jgi:hypothetical protein
MLAAMLLALEAPQLLLMALSFTAMLAFMGVALWLWLRQRSAARPTTPRRSERSSSAPIAEPTAVVAELTVVVAEPTRVVAEPTAVVAEPTAVVAELTEVVLVAEPTEFIALPHQRDIDAPRVDANGTEIIEALHQPPPERTFVMPAVDRTHIVENTEFIPAPLGSRDPAKPSPTLIDLPEHLRLAIDAFEQLQAKTPTPALAGHLDVLGSAPAATLLELVRPVLAHENGHRFAGALLTLLHNKTWPAKSELAPLLAELDEARKHTALALLRSWDDPRAEALAKAALAGVSDPDSRLLWLGCLAERGWDPGVAVIEAALADPDPRIIAVGLRLLPISSAAPQFQTKLASSLFASDPNVRMQAIEAALAFGNQSAWLVCRQLARNPGFPGAAQLVGLLGTDAEITEQCRAFESAPTPELLAGLGLSGRPVVLRACVERFDDPEAKLREAARAALTLAAGSAFESVTQARTWVASQEQRVLGGGQRSASKVLAVLEDASESTRRLLARELRIRSRGRLHVDPSLLPRAFARQLEHVQPRVSDIDFDRGFPWVDSRP